MWQGTCLATFSLATQVTGRLRESYGTIIYNYQIRIQSLCSFPKVEIKSQVALQTRRQGQVDVTWRHGNLQIPTNVRCHPELHRWTVVVSRVCNPIQNTKKSATFNAVLPVSLQDSPQEVATLRAVVNTNTGQHRSSTCRLWLNGRGVPTREMAEDGRSQAETRSSNQCWCRSCICSSAGSLQRPKA